MRENGRFFNKLRMYIFLILVVSCIITLTIFEYQQIKLYQKEQVEDEIITLNAYAEKYDNEINELFEYVDLLSTNGRISDFSSATLSEFDKIQLSKEMRENSIVRNFSNGNIILYKPEYDCFIADDGIEHLAEIKKKYGNIPYLKSEVEKFDEQLAIRIKKPNAIEKNGEYIVFFKRKTVDFEYDICFLVVLKKSIIEKELEQANINNFYITDDNEELFEYRESNEDSGRDMLWEESKLVLNWKYGMLKKELKVPLFFTYQSIIFLVLLLMGSFFASKYIAGKIYRPVKNLLEKISDGDDYDEFDAIENSFAHLMENNSNLGDKIELYDFKIKNRFLFDVFNGNIRVEDIQTEKAGITLNVSGKNFYIAMIVTENIMVAEIEFANVFEMILNTIADELSGDFFLLDNKRAVLMFPEYKKQDSERVIIEMATLAEQDFDNKIRAVLLNKIYTDISEIYGLHMGVIGLEAESYFSHEKIVLHKDDFDKEPVHNGEYFYSAETESKLISFVRNGDKEETFKLLKYIFDVNFVTSKLSSEKIVELKFALIMTARRVSALLGIDENELTNGQDIGEQIVFSHKDDKLWEVLEEFYNNIFIKINNEEQDRQTVLFKQINQYVLQNFCNMDEISAVNIATQFNVSPSYIYKLYKKMTGKAFIDYVLELRVEEAKKLLENSPQLKVKEIAEKVGYSNSTSFMRMFKKTTGMSPNSYRSKNARF